MNIFGIFHWIDVLWHWVVAFFNVLVVAGVGVLGFMWSPFLKELFLGIAIGATALAAINLDIVNFGQLVPKPQTQYCINPGIDPNGPAKQCWHKTDDRGYGYWGVCDGQE